MSQENVEIVRGLYDAISRGDTRIVLDTYDPEVTWDFTHSPFASVSKQTIYHGHDGLRAFMKERLEEAWDEIADELEELIDAEEQVISVVRSEGRGRTSGVKVSTCRGFKSLLRHSSGNQFAAARAQLSVARPRAVEARRRGPG